MTQPTEPEYRHVVEIHLAMSAVSVLKPSESRFCVDTSTNSLPKIPLAKGQNSLQAAEDFFRSLTGVSPTWLPIRQICTVDGRQDGAVVILYAVTMPEQTTLLKESTSWVDFETVSKNPELLRLIGYACNAYKIGTTL